MSTAGWQLRLQGPALQALEPDPGFHAEWQVLALHGTEGVNRLFRYGLRLRHPRLPRDLRPLLGRELQVHLCLPGAASGRVISALVSQVEHLGCVGSSQRGGAGAWGAGITLRAWPWLAGLQGACRIFQQRSVPEVLSQILDPYGFGWELRLRGRHPRLDYLVQFNQTDWSFVEYLCSRWGLHYHFEHDAEGHRLVLGDGPHTWRPQALDAFARLGVRAHAWGGDQASLHAVCGDDALGVQAWQSHTHPECHPEEIGTWLCEAPDAAPRPGVLSRWRGVDGIARVRRELEPAAEAGEPDAASEQALGGMRLLQARQGVSLLRGRGPLGGLCAGRTVQLELEPELESGAPVARRPEPSYLVLDTRLHFDSDANGVDDCGAAPVELEFVAKRLCDGIAAVAVGQRRRMPGTQTATVLDAVTPGDTQESFTDAIGRLRVRLHWANADAACATCWLRMARPSAGDGHGSADWPRPGDEVLVDFLDGDVDLPVCLGCVRNAAHGPPWPLPASCAVSGWRSREMCDDASTDAGAGTNHLLFDDTAGALQVQFASVSHDSALNLGRHVPIDPRYGRGDARGEGFELSTCAQAAVRAPRALLLVAAATAEAAACILHPLRACQQRLREALRSRGAGSVARDAAQCLPRGAGANLAEDLAGLAPPADASQAASVTAGAMAWHAEGALLAATASTGLITAGTDLALSAARDLELGCLRGLRMHADGAVLLAAAERGARLCAADGVLRAGSRAGELHVFARDGLQLAAARHTARVHAVGRVVLEAAGHRVCFGASGIEHSAAGPWKVHAARRCWLTQAAPGAGAGSSMQHTRSR